MARRLRRANGKGDPRVAIFMVRPAGRTYLEVGVLYAPGKGKDWLKARVAATHQRFQRHS